MSWNVLRSFDLCFVMDLHVVNVMSWHGRCATRCHVHLTSHVTSCFIPDQLQSFPAKIVKRPRCLVGVRPSIG